LKSEYDISPREIEFALFDILASGCATYPEVKHFLGEKFKGRTGNGNPDEERKSRLTDQSLFKLLSQLKKNDLIQSGRYYDRERGRNFVLYANSQNSVELLMESGYPDNHIRTPYLPGKFGFTHDQILTKTVRKIKHDSHICMYDYAFEDELALRRSSEKSKKGDMYPDLSLRLRNRSGDEWSFRIEVQRSRDRVQEFARKLGKTKNNIVLCKDRRLIHDIKNTHIYVHDHALFALIDDFLENGLFETKWLSSNCQVVGLTYDRS
jgi:hypothetical protein